MNFAKDEAFYQTITAVDGSMVQKGEGWNKTMQQTLERESEIDVDEMFGGKEILDLGAAEGEWCLYALRRGAKATTAVDASAAMAAKFTRVVFPLTLRHRGSVRFVPKDVFEFMEGVTDGEYDGILALNLTHHMKDKGVEFLQSIAEKVKNKGWILTTGYMQEADVLPRKHGNQKLSVKYVFQILAAADMIPVILSPFRDRTRAMILAVKMKVEKDER